MSEERWLRTNSGSSYGDLERRILERWPSGRDGPPKPTRPRSIENQLCKTDKGESTSKWWIEHEHLVPVLVELLNEETGGDRYTNADVRKWIEAGSPSSPDDWSPGLRKIPKLDVASPPSWLWPSVNHWVARDSGNIATGALGWLALEPGLPSRWLKKWLKAKGWRVQVESSWEPAKWRLKCGQRVFIHLTATEPVCPTVQDIVEGVTLLVGARHPLKNPDGSITSDPKWSDETPSRRWISVVDSPKERWPQIRSWFEINLPPGAPPLRQEVSDLLDQNDYEQGEVVSLLDCADIEDPQELWSVFSDDLDLEVILGIEEAAYRMGLSTDRSLVQWKSLVPSRTEAEILEDVRQAHARGDISGATALAKSVPDAVIGELLRLDILRPSKNLAVSWRIWPRWLGSRLSRLALDRMASTHGARGVALLAGDDGARRALADLQRLLVALNWDAIDGEFRDQPTTMEGIAAMEAAILVLGQYVLDGGDLGEERAIRALRALTQAAPGPAAARPRLLATGDGELGQASFIMAEWALGCRARWKGGAFGPWEPGPLLSEQEATLRTLDTAREEWEDQICQRRTSEHTRTEASTCLRRLARLGTLLFEEHGILSDSAKTDVVVWPMQVPALLVEVSRGQGELPGKSKEDFVAEVIRNHQEAGNFDENPVQRDLVTLIAGSIGAELDEGVKRRKAVVDQVIRTSSTQFSIVRAEVEQSGASFSDVLARLWSEWQNRGYQSSFPPIELLRRNDLDDARLVWRHAPVNLSKEYWDNASREKAFWTVLDDPAWRLWAASGVRYTKGWERMPEHVLFDVFPESLDIEAFQVAWKRIPGQVLDWLRRAAQGGFTDAHRTALREAPGVMSADILVSLPETVLPTEWIQGMVTHRDPGWKRAWEVLHLRMKA